MNKIKCFQAFFSKNEIKIYFLCLSIFFLPLHMGLNNLFLGLFVFAYFIEGDWTIKIKNIKNNYASLIPITVFFIIYAIGLFYSEFTFNALKQVERSVPFLILPLTILSQPLLYEKRFNSFFYSLVFGCLLAAIICWGVLSYNLISNGEIYKIFTWERRSKESLCPDFHQPQLKLRDSVGLVFSL